jgi:hypothetical protein
MPLKEKTVTAEYECVNRNGQMQNTDVHSS